MELLLIRHATAESSAASDFERALTEVGSSQAEKVGQFLKRSNLLPDVTLASPLVRARQTAGIICSSAGAQSPLIEPWLACGMTPASAMQVTTPISNILQRGYWALTVVRSMSAKHH
jgi:phosphohistidine phosphatase SixA